MKFRHGRSTDLAALMSTVVLLLSAGFTTGSTSSLGCVSSSAGDGFCDQANNNEDCGFDNGDCCPCKCVGVSNDFCALLQSRCVDPDALCLGDITDFTFVPTDDEFSDHSYTSLGCIPAYIADGDCDRINNNEDCGYDGGDCCQCTCVSTPAYTCGENSGFECVDPSASCVDDDDVVTLPSNGFTTSLGCTRLHFGDAECDISNNNEECVQIASVFATAKQGGIRRYSPEYCSLLYSKGYDGGDCCQCTYVSTQDSTCGENGVQCVDPSARCVDDDDGTVKSISDELNTFSDDSFGTSLVCIPACFGYDGGDCCQCTCVDTAEFTCGVSGFQCVDPSAPCVNDDDGTLTSISDDLNTFSDDSIYTSSGCIPANFGDGDCDTFNDNEACEYDGGDCCQCTCVDTEMFTCGINGFLCVDPSAPCVDDDDVTVVSTVSSSYTSLGCIPGYIGDGYCDTANDIAGCEYDGGDCCQCTCVDTERYTCGENGFQCVDPSASCVDDDDVTAVRTYSFTDDLTTSSACAASNIGDNFCDPENNNEDCDFDGGDCCPCTCHDLPAYICAYYQDILCIDPSSSCEDEEDLPQCFGDLIGDGKCDQDNNNENCDFDGGDCCECSCVSTSVHTCGDNDGFQCVDPSVYCLDGFVEAGTKTVIGVTANAYDERAGEQGNDIGCGQEGCTPSLVRDGVFTNTESRWSCAGKIFPDGGVCEIGFTFETPQDIVDLQVAFWKRAERERTLKVTVNGDAIGEFTSDSESAFTTFVIDTDMVQTLTLESVGIGPTEWISLLEVRFIVDP